MALEVFKILHKESPVYLHALISFKNNHYSYILNHYRYTRMAEIPPVKQQDLAQAAFVPVLRSCGILLHNISERSTISTILKAQLMPGTVPVLRSCGILLHNISERSTISTILKAQLMPGTEGTLSALFVLRLSLLHAFRCLCYFCLF